MPAAHPTPRPPLFLALDQGGHSSRALIYDSESRLIAHACREIQARRGGDDRYEYDPERLLESVRAALAEALSHPAVDPGQVAAAGLATQRSNVMCWDRETGAALSPVIAWQDRRGRARLEGLRPAEARIREITGLPCSPHYGAGKLTWCLEHLPEVQRARRSGRLAWGPMASFLLFRLLEGRPLMADAVNAARTLLLDIERCDWSAEMLELFSLPREPLPPCVPTQHHYGTLALGEAAIPLAVTTGDQAAALYAFGAPRERNLQVTVGTGAFVQRPAGTRRPHAGRLLDSLVHRHGGRCHYAVEGTVNGAGSALDWLGARYPGSRPARDLPQWMADVDEPPLFLNGVAGLGTPFLVPEFEPRFVGGGGLPQRGVAVVESIAFLLQANIEELTQRGLPIEQICIGGGLARLDAFCQRLADLCGLPVARPAAVETTARGLAYLACAATGEARAGWSEAGALERFAPRVDKGLASRYHRWRAALEQALGQEGPS